MGNSTIEHSGKTWKSGRRDQGQGGFCAEQGLQNKIGRHQGCDRGDGSFWGTSGLSAFSNTVVLVRFAACTRSCQEKNDISSNGACEIGGCKGVFGLFELATRIRQGLRDTGLNLLAGRTHLVTLAICARSATVWVAGGRRSCQASAGDKIERVSANPGLGAV